MRATFFWTLALCLVAVIMASGLQIEKTHNVEGAKRRTVKGDDISMRTFLL